MFLTLNNICPNIYLLFLPRARWLSFLPCWPIELLPLSLGFFSSFTLSLPLIPPMGLLAVISTILTHWACYLFPWASSANLLYLYLLFVPRVCWLSFLPCLPIGFNNLLLPFKFHFPSTSLIVGLLLLLGFLSKVGINNDKE